MSAEVLDDWKTDNSDSEDVDEYEYTRGSTVTDVPPSLAKLNDRNDNDWFEGTDSRYYGENSPNKPPAFKVPNRIAVEIELVSDEDLVQQVAEFWFPSEPERYVEVACIIFNDMSVWYFPLPSWDEDYAGTRHHVVKEFVPEVIKARSDKAGMDGDWHKHLWEVRNGLARPDWLEDVDNAELSEANREWFNENADWIRKIRKNIESQLDEVDIEVENTYSWEDDW
jgi:hypothetical protein